jgi:hypothetical protein
MKTKQKEYRDNFLAKFNHCYDGVVRAIQLEFSPSTAFGNALVTLSVCHSETKTSQNEWVNVRLSISDVEEFSLRETPNEQSRVLSSGLQIGSFGELVFFDFAPYSVCPNGMEDYRRSGFYVAGHSFTWRVEPYSEQVSSKERRKTPSILR